jgi:DNA repair ATPase RecN
MSGNSSRLAKDTINKYFTRSTSLEQPSQQTSQTPPAAVPKTKKMAPTDDKVTNAELKDLLKSVDARMEDGFKGLNQKVNTLTERFDGLEVEVEEVKKEQGRGRNDIDKMREEMADLKRSLLTTQVYSRKYHLLLYGVEGYETSPEEKIKRVREFAEKSLKLGEKFATDLTIRNAHRLRRQMDRATPIIVVFVYWSERETFLGGARNLKGTPMSVRTDLPPELK